MGLPQDRDEQEMSAPVVSLSLGDTAPFRAGGLHRNAQTRSFRLASGDATSLAGEAPLASTASTALSRALRVCFLRAATSI
jgi:alkylated DNA repair protein (DNA oxidative demethylase)